MQAQAVGPKSGKQRSPRMRSIQPAPLILAALSLSACDAWFGRRIDLPPQSDAVAIETILAYAREHDIPCGQAAALPLECWRQPIRIRAASTAQGITVCYNATGIPLEAGKFNRRMDELEAKLRARIGAAVATPDISCPALLPRNS